MNRTQKIKNYIKKHKIKTIILPIILIIIIGIGTKLLINWNNKLILNENNFFLKQKKDEYTYFSTKTYKNLAKYKWLNFKNFKITETYKDTNGQTKTNIFKSKDNFYIGIDININKETTLYNDGGIPSTFLGIENYNKEKQTGNFKIQWNEGEYENIKINYLNIELDK